MASMLKIILTLADEIETKRVGDGVLKAELPPKVNLTFMARVGWIDASEASLADSLRRDCQVLQIPTEGYLTLLPGFHAFISAWNASVPDIMGMHYPLLSYLPYAQFFDMLPSAVAEHHQCKTLALALGAAGRNPKTGELWKARSTHMDTFRSTCKDVYQRSPRTAGYANLGCLMAEVCERLQLSYQHGHALLEWMVKSSDEAIQVEPGKIRRHGEEGFQRITLVPRNEIVRKRTQAALLGKPRPEPVWTTRENLQDGFEIGSTLCKLIKWR